MFAILAAIVFAVGVFGGHIFSLNLLYLGLLLLAVHFIWSPLAMPWNRNR
jgi:hypothetical protein